jgi:hypothetical protein
MSEIKPEIVNSAKLTVTYDTNRSKGSNDFSNLQELKKWLDNNPLIAEKLGYTKKK